MTIFRKIGEQFKKPTGFGGKIISFMMIRGNRSAYEILIKELALHTNDKILEIGYGPGIGINLISKRSETSDIYGIDFSGLMFRKSSGRNKKFIKSGKVHLLMGDFVDTDIKLLDFDKIFCLNVVYFWDDLKKPFEKVRLMLKDDGLFCFYMESKDNLNKTKFTKEDVFNKYSIEQITENLKSAGFNQIEYFFRRGYYIKARK